MSTNTTNATAGTKTRETRVRRAAARDGQMLVKTRIRDHALRPYVLATDTAGNRYGRRGGQEALSALHAGHGMTLDEVEAALGIVR